VGFLEDRGHVDDVGVADVRAEDGPESVIAVPIEGQAAITSSASQPK
jgi:hypothetical protein